MSASDVGRECRIRNGRVAGNEGRNEENAADLVFASDVGRECRISVGQRYGGRTSRPSGPPACPLSDARPVTLTTVGLHARLRWAFARVYKALRLKVNASCRLI